jgi:hypothetical protein
MAAARVSSYTAVMRRCRAAMLLPLALGLPGCSFGLDLRLASASGTPVFEREQRRCVTAFRISSGDARYSAHPPDPEGLKGRLVWAIEPRRGRQGCLRFPITYGRAPAGAVQTVPPEPLVPGMTYAAIADGDFNVGGSIAFRLRDGAIEVVDDW